MKKRIAHFLRALAERLAPAPTVPTVPTDAEPLAFVPTADLASEIMRRSDVALLVWGKTKITTRPDGQKAWDFPCLYSFKLNHGWEIYPVAQMLIEKVETLEETQK